MIPAHTEPVVQRAAHRLGRDFARVTRADGRDRVCENDSGFETIHLPVKFRAVHVEKILWQVCQRKRAGRKNSLIREVVDCQAGRRRIHPAFRAFLVQHQRRHKRGLPVVNVDYFRPPRQVARQMRDAFREKNEARVIVRVTDVVLKINPVAFKKSRMINEINRQVCFQLPATTNPPAPISHPAAD